MPRLSRLATYFVFPVVALFLLTEPAYADALLGILAYSGSPVGTISIFTMGIGFIVVFIIETIIVKRVADVNWTAALSAALMMNLVSTIFGAVTAYVAGASGCFIVILFPLAVIVFWIALWLLKYTRGFIALVILCSASGILAAFLLMECAGFSIAGLSACIVVQLIFGFGMSLFFEAISVGRFIPREKIERSVLLVNLGSYVFLLLMAPFFWPNPVLMSSRAIPSMEKLMLRDEGREAAMMLYRKNLSTLELLGLKKIKVGEEEYDATVFIELAESELLYNALEKHWPGYIDDPGKPDVYDSLVEYAEYVLSIPNIRDSDMRDMQWFGLSAAMWPLVSSAMYGGDAEGTESAYIEWRKKEEEIDSPRYGAHGNGFDPLFWMYALAVARDVDQDVKDKLDELISIYGMSRDMRTPLRDSSQ